MSISEEEHERLQKLLGEEGDERTDEMKAEDEQAAEFEAKLKAKIANLKMEAEKNAVKKMLKGHVVTTPEFHAETRRVLNLVIVGLIAQGIFPKDWCLENNVDLSDYGIADEYSI